MGLNLFARLGLDAKPFYAALGGIKSSFSKLNEKFGSDLKGQLAGALTLGATVAAVKGIADYASNIKNLSDQYGITTEEAQKFEAQTTASGYSFEKFLGVIDRIGSARKEAVESNDAILKSFARFGVTLDDLNNGGLRNIDIVYKLANAVGSLQSAADREAFGELVGASGKKFLSLLQNINDSTPIVLLSDEEVKKLDEASSKLQALGRDYKSLFSSVLSEGVEAYNKLSGKIGGVSGKLIGALSAPFAVLGKGVGVLADGLSGSLESDGNKRHDALPLPEKNNDPLFDNKRKDESVRNDKDRDLKTLLAFKSEGNMLSRIGLFTGGVPVPMISIGREQIAEIKRTTQEVRELRRSLERKL